MTLSKTCVGRSVHSCALIAALAIAAPAGAQAPAGWKTVVDSTGTCAISLPSNWTRKSGSRNRMQGPGGAEAFVMVNGFPGPLKALTPQRQSLYMVDKLFSNTAQRVFYLQKPAPIGDAAPQSLYMVEVGGKRTCVAEILMPLGTQDALAKQIAATVVQAK